MRPLTPGKLINSYKNSTLGNERAKLFIYHELRKVVSRDIIEK